MIRRTSGAQRALMAALVCALAALGIAAVSGASAGSTPTAESPTEVQNLSPPDSSTLTRIYSKARASAGEAGEPSPSGMETTTATIGQAMTLADPSSRNPSQLIDPRSGKPWSESAVYVVTMHGNFTLGAASTPPGRAAPTGTVLTLMIDRASGEVAGRHLGDASVDLHQLSPTVTSWATP